MPPKARPGNPLTKPLPGSVPGASDPKYCYYTLALLSPPSGLKGEQQRRRANLRTPERNQFGVTRFRTALRCSKDATSSCMADVLSFAQRYGDSVRVTSCRTRNHNQLTCPKRLENEPTHSLAIVCCRKAVGGCNELN
jgi:hypothetical protein